MKKRILSWALVLCMVLTLLPSAAFAADDEIVSSGTCGDGTNLTWKLTRGGTLTISGEGKMMDYTYLSTSSSPWSSLFIKAVVLQSGVTSIGDYAFYNCYSLTSVTIPDSVTTIGDYAFEGCKSLTSVTIPDSVTTIGSRAFFDCISLMSVTIGNSVTSIDTIAFAGCSSLTDIQVADGNSTYCSIDGVVFSKDQKTLVTCPCGKQGDYLIPNSVITIEGWAFHGCSSLTSVTIPDSVTSIGFAAFSYCRSLTSVTIPDSVTTIGTLAFSDCRSLTSVTIPDSVTTIGSHAFRNCSSLTNVTIPDSVTTIEDYTFSYCSSLTSVTIPNSVTYIDSSAFSYCSSLTSVTIPNSVTTIGDYAFNGCSSLTDVYYGGPEAQWSAIAILTGNDSLLNATIHYNSIHTHTHPEAVTENEIAASCTTDGSYDSVIYCSICGEEISRVTIIVPALGHKWDDGIVTTEPTEETEGVKTYTCTVCGETRTEKIPVLEHVHNYSAVITKPTCTEQGYTTHTCACGDSYVDSYVDALGHKTELKNAKAATCTEAGYTGDLVCTRCNVTVTKGDVIAALGHKWDDGVVTTEPTATTDGVKTYTCTVCGETKTEVIPATGEQPIDPVKPIDPTTVFTDVAHDWAYPGIEYCYNHGLMAGTSETTFSPEEALTRGQFVAILWRQLGCPAPQGANPFTDLTQDYYRDAITWAAENKVVYGATATTFEPDRAITRQELTAMFYRYVGGYLKQDVSVAADISTFPDYSSVADYAQAAMAWAKGVGLISGNEINGTIYLDPLGAATRAQAATMFMNLCERVLK